MFDHRLRKTWILLWLCIATAAPARADGPGAGFKLDPKATVFTSPDRKVRLEQYAKETEDGDLVYQFWTFDRNRRQAFLLNPDDGDDPQHWPDSRYVVISLSFDMQGEDDKTAPWIEDWHCVYDLKTGAFSVPPDFAENNAKAVTQPKPK
jgi:hypothetical protein